MNNSLKETQLIILAAGDGGRMGGVNKCLLQIQGKSILDYYRDKFQNIVLVIGYNHQELIKHLNGTAYVINTEWESTNSAYSLKLALERNSGDSIIVDGDTLFLGEIDRDGFYCCRPEYHFFSPQNTFEKCSALQFIGIARTSEAENLRYLKDFSEKNANNYWCEIYKDIKIVETKDKWFEIDTWGDYKIAVQE